MYLSPTLTNRKEFTDNLKNTNVNDISYLFMKYAIDKNSLKFSNKNLQM